MKKIIIPLLMLVLLVGGAASYYFYSNQAAFEGSRVRNPDSYTLTFTRMNQTDSHTLTLKTGDLLDVDFAISSGKVNLMIENRKGTSLYRGNDIDQGIFSLEIPQDGDYVITVEASRASGCISVVLE